MQTNDTVNGAIVLGTNVNGVAVIRSLGRLGVACGAVYSRTPNDQARHSKYLKVACEVSDSANPSEVTTALGTVADSLGARRPVLIATTDRYSQFLCKNQASLSKRYRLTCADPDLYDAFLDKWKTVGICQQYDILIPDTICPTSMDELRHLAPGLPYPVIVKPRYTFDRAFPGKNAVLADFAALKAFFERHRVIGNAVIQRIIRSGDGDILVTVSYSGADGRTKAMYSGRKIRQYLPDYGATCFGISERHPELEEESRAFLDAIGYKGFAALEFARSREDGRPYFLELNTRTYYHNQLFADAGVDLTQIGYLETVGREYADIVDRSKQREGVIWLDFQRDFAAMRIKRRHGQITICQWLRSIVAARSFAWWSWHDPKPFFMSCLWMIRQRWRRLVASRRRPEGPRSGD